MGLCWLCLSDGDTEAAKGPGTCPWPHSKKVVTTRWRKSLPEPLLLRYVEGLHRVLGSVGSSPCRILTSSQLCPGRSRSNPQVIFPFLNEMCWPCTSLPRVIWFSPWSKQRHLCFWVCTHTHAQMHTYTQIHVHTHTNTHITTHMYKCTPTFTNTHLSAAWHQAPF